MIDKKPGCWLFVLAAFLVFCGLAAVGAGIAGFLLDLNSMTEGVDRVVIPGSGTVQVQKPGKYTIFHELVSEIGGEKYTSSAGLNQFQLNITDPKGEPVQLTPVDATITYSSRKHSGRAVMSFSTGMTGTYTVKGTRLDGKDGPTTVIAVMHGFGGAFSRAFLWLFGGIGIGAIVTVTGIVTLVLGLIMRGRQPRAPA